MIDEVAIEAFLLAIIKIVVIVVHDLTFIVVLDGFVKEAMLSVLESTWVTIQNVSSVAASVLYKFLTQELIDNFLGDADWKRCLVNFRPFFTIWWVTTLCLNFFSHLGAAFIALCLNVCPESIFTDNFLIEKGDA